MSERDTSAYWATTAKSLRPLPSTDRRGLSRDRSTQPHHRLLVRSGKVRSFSGRDTRAAGASPGGPFEVVELDNGVSLDFAAADGPIQPQHYAFLISEVDFDAVFGRIREQGLEYWADPRRSRPGEINHNDGGRGVYFPDPDGHYLEVITRPYGSAGS
jgi:catechol 2,3-dioxygenase-like lactoylglutathione lyase family enzyme